MGLLTRRVAAHCGQLLGSTFDRGAATLSVAVKYRRLHCRSEAAAREAFANGTHFRHRRGCLAGKGAFPPVSIRLVSLERAQRGRQRPRGMAWHGKAWRGSPARGHPTPMAYKCRRRPKCWSRPTSRARTCRLSARPRARCTPPGVASEPSNPEEVCERAGRGQAAADGVAGDRQGLGCEPAAIPRGPAYRAKGDGLAPCDDFRHLIAEERRRSRRAVARFVAAVRANDVAALYDSIDGVETSSAWGQAFRHSPGWPMSLTRCAWRCSSCGRRAATTSAARWGTTGRCWPACRCCCRAMRGRRRAVPRGSLWNGRRRSYGLSWSADEAVADAFARGLWRTVKGGSAVLRRSAAERR